MEYGSGKIWKIAMSSSIFDTLLLPIRKLQSTESIVLNKKKTESFPIMRLHSFHLCNNIHAPLWNWVYCLYMADWIYCTKTVVEYESEKIGGNRDFTFDFWHSFAPMLQLQSTKCIVLKEKKTWYFTKIRLDSFQHCRTIQFS